MGICQNVYTGDLKGASEVAKGTDMHLDVKAPYKCATAECARTSKQTTTRLSNVSNDTDQCSN